MNFIADSCQVLICNIKAGFMYEQNACDSKTIQFNDTTLNADSIAWDFGNGQTDTAHDPLIKYADYGNHVIHLYAMHSCLNSTVSTIKNLFQHNNTSTCNQSILHFPAYRP